MDIDEIFKKDAFKLFDEDKKQAVKEVIEKTKGKKPLEAMPIFMEYMNRVKQTRPLSKEEKQAMIIAILETMPPEEQKKFKAIVNLMETQ